MSDQAPQRAWKAACTACGAPVLFQSAASPMAVCSFCRSTLVREGEALRRIGQVAELFDDHSPLQLGMRGSYQGESFTLVGQIQLAYQDDDQSEGRWSEWHALFDSGKSACLSEDNGAYVLTFPQSLGAATLPDLQYTWVGDSVLIAGRPWVVSAIHQVHVHAFAGELDHVPDQSGSYPVVECRNERGEVLAIEPRHDPPRLDMGRSVELSDLKLLSGGDAKVAQEAALRAKGLECPHCGAALTPQLDACQSLTCGQCKSVIDISQGVGGDLKYYRQQNGLEPLIPMGTVGRLMVGGRVDAWQVVGYQERFDSVDDSTENVFWREYLLYNRGRGFAFLVDSEDGWSVVRPITGVPTAKGNHRVWQDVQYRKRYVYSARTSYVLGEFYWPVKQDQVTRNIDYVSRSGQQVLNREQSGKEVVWSVGETLDAKEVMKAFGIKENMLRAFRRDIKPWMGDLFVKLLSSSTFWWILFIVVMFTMMRACTDDCAEVKDYYGELSNEYKQCRASQSSGGYRGSSGGSYGGYNSGGFHK